jgi:oligoribonuclease NrnB/cAMP/cGMP phosphodiesterase (DHH superfamily)
MFNLLNKFLGRVNRKIEPRTYILYHSNCLDGYSSAYAAWKKFGDDGAIYIPVSYGEPVPHIELDSIVYICDFSYPLATLRNLEAEMKSVMVLDHHASAMQDLSTFSNAIFDMERSGCTITWSYFHKTKVPLFLRYMEDRDIWRFRMLYTKEVFALAEATPQTFRDWDLLVNEFDKYGDGDELEEGSILLYAGATLLRYKEQIVEKIIASSLRLMYIEGHLVPVVNAPKSFGTECCAKVLNTYPQYTFSAYYHDEVGKRIWGFRSVGEFDVSSIARVYGGGGHKNASGCVISYPDQIQVGKDQESYSYNEFLLRQ